MLAKDSKATVPMGAFGFPVKYLGEWMMLNGCPELTEADAVKLLGDEEFLHNVMEDVFRFASDSLEDARDPSEGAERYEDPVKRLGVPWVDPVQAVNGYDDDDEEDDYDSELDDSDSDLEEDEDEE